MGQWSKINQKKSLKERITGKEDGKEDPFAANRRGLRECGDTTDEEMPTRSRTPDKTR